VAADAARSILQAGLALLDGVPNLHQGSSRTGRMSRTTPAPVSPMALRLPLPMIRVTANRGVDGEIILFLD